MTTTNKKQSARIAAAVASLAPAPIVERTITGGWSVSTVHNGYRICRTFYGYTRRQSVAMFREELATL